MRRNILLLLLFVGVQMASAQNLSRANVNTYVENKYGHSWKDIAQYFAETDVLDENNALNFEKVIPVSGKTKEQLYIDLNYWFLKMFTNASSKIEMSDKELGIILAKGYLPQIANHSGGMSSYYVNIRPIIRCDVKDDEVKVTVTVPNYEVTRVDDGVVMAMLDEDFDKHPPFKVDQTWPLNHCFPFAKKDGAKRTSSKALAMTHGYVEMLLQNIENQIGNATQQQSQIEMVVHRGANALAPENTIASADSALAHGATWIEVDVRKSKDGVLFNLHDETLDRTTDGKGKLSDMKSEEVRKLDAGAWFSPKFAGTPIPTIAEMLDHLHGKAKVFFDVKKGTPIEDLVKLVREKDYSDKSFFWFASEAMLREFVRIAPDLKVKVNVAGIASLKYWQKICVPAYVEIAPQSITSRFMGYCHLRNMKVIAACQEDDTSQFQLVLDKKPDMVNLDRPEVFEKLLK